jgi:hypothetical protein
MLVCFFLQTMIMVKLLNAVMFTWLLFIGCVVSEEITCQPHIGISTVEVMCANLCNSKMKIFKKVVFCWFLCVCNTLGYFELDIGSYWRLKAMVGYWKLLELLESLGGEAIIAECVLEWRYWRTNIGELIFESKHYSYILDSKAGSCFCHHGFLARF